MKYFNYCILIMMLIACKENVNKNRMSSEVIINNNDFNISVQSNDIERLIFENNFYGMIPYSKLKVMSNLSYLESKNGELREFIGDGLKPIDTLVLTNNKIDILVNIDSITNMVHLDVSKNRLKDVDGSGLLKLKNLKHLNLSFNLIKNIKSFDELVGLEWLDLSSNRLNTLDSSIVHLRELKYLDISDNLFESIPKEVLRLPSLEVLKTSDNYLSNEDIKLLREKYK